MINHDFSHNQFYFFIYFRNAFMNMYVKAFPQILLKTCIKHPRQRMVEK